MKIVKEIYGDEYKKAESLAAKQAFAKTLLEKGRSTRDDLPGRFVLLKLSRDVATQGLDGLLAFQAVDALAEFARKNCGDVRLLINNAGIEMLGLVWELTPAQWQASMEININGVFHGVRSFMPGMMEAVKRGGRAAIANLSSVGGVSMSPMMTPYIVSKHAVLAFTECLNLEMELTGIPIDVSVITPGMVRTSIFEDAPISSGENTTLAEKYRVAMRDFMASDGMEVGAASKFMFEQLAARTFWVSTQPEMTESFAAQRAAYLRERARPKLNQVTREALGLN